MLLENQVIIVTGSSRGIGQAIALLFSREGARVVVMPRHADACETVAERIRSEGGQALVVPTDVTDEAQVAHLVQATLVHFGRVGFRLITNLGTPPRQPKVIFKEKSR